MSIAPAVEASPDLTDQRKGLRWLWVTIVGLVVVGGGVALWLLLAGDGQPTITWDGTEAVYSGPEELEAGIHTFKLENNGEWSVDFHYARHDPDYGTVTIEEVGAWTGPDAPPWVEGNAVKFARVRSGLVVEERAAFIADNRYELVVYNLGDSKGYAAAIIEIPGSDD